MILGFFFFMSHQVWLWWATFCDLWQWSGFVEEKSVIIHMGVASYKKMVCLLQW